MKRSHRAKSVINLPANIRPIWQPSFIQPPPPSPNVRVGPSWIWSDNESEVSEYARNVEIAKNTEIPMSSLWMDKDKWIWSVYAKGKTASNEDVIILSATNRPHVVVSPYNLLFRGSYTNIRYDDYNYIKVSDCLLYTRVLSPIDIDNLKKKAEELFLIVPPQLLMQIYWDNKSFSYTMTIREKGFNYEIVELYAQLIIKALKQIGWGYNDLDIQYRGERIKHCDAEWYEDYDE